MPRSAKPAALFGFALPSLPIFGGGGDAGGSKPKAGESAMRAIIATIRSARRDGDAYWVVTLEDGAVCHQTDGVVALAPHAGGTATIRRASLGSYFMRMGSQPGVKARREG